jgi:glycosyltransferase involved in cell wall biosynthesis
MKLACVIHRFGPQITGGSEAHCRAIAVQLAAQGHDVEILTSCATDYVTWANVLDPGESQDGALRVRRFPVTRPRHLNRFREISEWVFTGRATDAEQEEWFRTNGPDLPALLEHLRANGNAYDRVLFWSYRYAPTFFGLPLVADRAILVPTAEDDEIIRTATILGNFFTKPRAYLFLTPEERDLVAARCTGPLPPFEVIGAGVTLAPSPPSPPSPPTEAPGERGEVFVGGTVSPQPRPPKSPVDRGDGVARKTASPQPRPPQPPEDREHGVAGKTAFPQPRPPQPSGDRGDGMVPEGPFAQPRDPYLSDEGGDRFGGGTPSPPPTFFGGNDGAGGIRPFALYLGRIEKNKGCDRLVDYFLSYAEGGRPGMELVMAGPSIMEIPRHPAIRVLGFVENAVRDELLARARVLVMPSPYESLSMVLLEAWRVGTPALVYGRCKPLRGQTARANGGLFYEQREEFSEALAWFATHPAEARQFGLQGQAYVSREYQWPVVLAKISRILNV